jgi:hypothetical protein
MRTTRLSSLSTGWRGGIVAALGLLAMAILPDPAMAQQKGEIGGPATSEYVRDCEQTFGWDPGSEILSKEALVIGVRNTRLGLYEIVACGTSDGPCIAIDQVGRGYGGTCLAYSRYLKPNRNFRIDLAGWSAGRQGGRFQIAGPISAKVARIVTRVRRRARRGFRRQRAILANPSQEILDRLQVTQPFGYFATIMRGCPANNRVRSFAYMATGKRLGYLNGTFRICESIREIEREVEASRQGAGGRSASKRSEVLDACRPRHVYCFGRGRLTSRKRAESK